MGVLVVPGGGGGVKCRHKAGARIASPVKLRKFLGHAQDCVQWSSSIQRFSIEKHAQNTSCCGVELEEALWFKLGMGNLILISKTNDTQCTPAH